MLLQWVSVDERLALPYFCLMAEQEPNLNKLGAANCTSKPLPLPITLPDVIVLRFELDEHTPVTQCARDLLFNSEMQEESQGTQRSLHATLHGVH